eukprot:gene15934-biopygen8209
MLVRVRMFGGRCWSGYACLADDAGPGTYVWRTLLARVRMFGGTMLVAHAGLWRTMLSRCWLTPRSLANANAARGNAG